MLKRANWRALQWIEATPAEPMQMELPFASFRRWRMKPNSPQLVLLFPSFVSRRDVSSLDNAHGSLGGTRHMDGKRNE
jgi:hypothetical protein